MALFFRKGLKSLTLFPVPSSLGLERLDSGTPRNCMNRARPVNTAHHKGFAAGNSKKSPVVRDCTRFFLSEFRVSGFGFWISGFRFRVSAFGFRFWVSGSESQISGCAGFAFRVSGFGSRILRFGSRVSGFGFRVQRAWIYMMARFSAEISSST